MTAKLTDIQQRCVDFLLYEWESIEEFAKTLATVESSQEIDFFAKNYNWGDGLEPLKLVLNHPLCDFGTALKIYWLGQPDYYAGFVIENNIPACNRDVYLFLKFIESLIAKDHFQHNQIQFDPIADFPIEQRHHIAKYAEISEKLLLPNYGDNTKNIAKLKLYREQPDDAETLNFLIHKYLRSHDYVRAHKCAEKLLLFNSMSQRNWDIKISVLEEIEKSQEAQNIKTKDSNIIFDRNIHQVRQELAKCYQKTIQLDREDIDNSNSDRFIRERIIETQEKLANVYLRDRDYERAIETLKIILEQVQTKPVLDVDFDDITLRLAKIYQELQDYDRALSYIDIFLKDVPEFEYLYFHKLMILRLMGRQQEADNLLSQMIETLDNTIQEKQLQDRLEAYCFYQKSTLLEEYKDFQAAADCLQAIIDLELYYNDENRLKQSVLEIEALRTKSLGFKQSQQKKE